MDSAQQKAPQPVASGGSDLRSIIVWGAKGIRDADFLGLSDAYCIVRVGTTGTPWEKLSRGTGRRSEAVRDSADPQWRMGFTVDVQGIKNPEVQIRVYDKDGWAGEDDFLGTATVLLGSLQSSPSETPLQGDGAQGSVQLSAGPVGLLTENDIKPSGIFETTAPIGVVKSVKVEDITSTGPLRVATAPLPKTMRGIFWLTGQGGSSALASFAGPSNDGGGMSPGQLIGENKCKYDVRVAGDRVWAFADRNALGFKFSEDVDLVYHFIFDDAMNPTKVQIYPDLRNLNVNFSAEWLLDFEGVLDPENTVYPGSVCWKRPSFALGRQIDEYTLVQVMDENGNRIEPAWGAFVAYQSSKEAGSSPGEVFYHEIS